jgi:hypothetical protein
MRALEGIIYWVAVHAYNRGSDDGHQNRNAYSSLSDSIPTRDTQLEYTGRKIHNPHILYYTFQALHKC